MSDVVVTCPKGRWSNWLAEGDLAGDAWTGSRSYFRVPMRPAIVPGERVYIVAHGKLRGYAPLVEVAVIYERDDPRLPSGEMPGMFLVREAGAVAVTIAERAMGFQGFRYRWWDRSLETTFAEWRNP